MSIFSLCFCFPPSSRVLTTKGQVPISDLQRFDILVTTVQLSNGLIRAKESPFLSYIHFDPDLQAKFLTLKCENGAELTVSEDHLVFKVLENKTWKPLRAKDVQVEDRLIHLDDSKLASYPKVCGIGSEVIKGVYAPLSMAGVLVVDNILTSCYANVDSHWLAHAALAPMRLWYRHRNQIALRFNGTLSKKDEIEKKEEENHGIHKYAKALMTFTQTLPKKIQPEL